MPDEDESGPLMARATVSISTLSTNKRHAEAFVSLHLRVCLHSASSGEGDKTQNTMSILSTTAGARARAVLQGCGVNKAVRTLLAGCQGKWGAPGAVSSYSPILAQPECCEVFFSHPQDFNFRIDHDDANDDGDTSRVYTDERYDAAATVWRSWAPILSSPVPKGVVETFAYDKDPPAGYEWCGKQAVGFTNELYGGLPVTLFSAACREQEAGKPPSERDALSRRVVDAEAGLAHVIDHHPELRRLCVDDLTQQLFFRRLEEEEVETEAQTGTGTLTAAALPNLESFTFTLCTELTDERLARVFAAFPKLHELVLKACPNVTEAGLARLLRDGRLSKLSALGVYYPSLPGADTWAHSLLTTTKRQCRPLIRYIPRLEAVKCGINAR